MRCASVRSAGRRCGDNYFKKILQFSLTECGCDGIIFTVLRRYLSWIEGLTTNQNVTGSNPVRRTS